VGLPVATGLSAARDLAPRQSALTLGVFDGVHRGHRHIIDTLSARRGRDGINSVFVMTFDPHPVVVTHSRETPPILSSIEERIELLSDCDIDGVFVVPFDEQVASMHYRDFIQRYFIEAMDMKELVLGYDCHFGHKREGSPEVVAEEGKRQGFGVHIVPPVEYAGVVVSSTTIRKRPRGRPRFSHRQYRPRPPAQAVASAGGIRGAGGLERPAFPGDDERGQRPHRQGWCPGDRGPYLRFRQHPLRGAPVGVLRGLDP
jgi:hypothetical protein